MQEDHERDRAAVEAVVSRVRAEQRAGAEEKLRREAAAAADMRAQLAARESARRAAAEAEATEERRCVRVLAHTDAWQRLAGDAGGLASTYVISEYKTLGCIQHRRTCSQGKHLSCKATQSWRSQRVVPGRLQS
jgi:hypothetical protein